MYAKLFQQLLSSSLTEKESIEVRGVFFMLMAAADKSGKVLGSDETIARIINVPVEIVKRSIEALLKPDAGSRNKEHEGRRLLPLEDGLGYFLTGYPKYSGIRTDEERREYFRIKQRESRAARVSTDVNNSKQQSTEVNSGEQPSTSVSESSAPASPWLVAFGLDLPVSLQTDNCLAAALLWMEYKRERKEPYKPIGLKAAMSTWAREFTPAEFPLAVELSIGRGWMGVTKVSQASARPGQPAGKLRRNIPNL